MAAISQADYDALITRRSTVLTQLNSMTSSSVGGKADTNQPGSAEHVAYRLSLYEELKMLNGLLEEYDIELNGGSVEIISEGIV